MIALASETAGVPRTQRIYAQLAQELARARRYEYPLTAVVLHVGSDESMIQTGFMPANGENGKADVPSAHLTQCAFFLVGSFLRGAIRESDIVTYDAMHNQYIILLPVSRKLQALQVARRLQALLYRQTLTHLRAGFAEFPADGLTVEDLISSARAACRYQAINGELPGSAGAKAGEGHSSA
jgi:hypothetical protein